MAVFDILARLRIDKGDADTAFAPLGAKADDLKKKLNVPVAIDTGNAQAGLAGLNEQVGVQVRSVNEWKAKLVELRAERDKAEDTATIDKLNERIEVAAGQIKALQTPVKQGFDTKPVENFHHKIDETGGHIKEQESKIDGLKEHLKEGLSIGAGFIGLEGIGQTIEGSIEEFQKQSRETRSLKLAFADLGGQADATVEQLTKFAEEQSKSTEFTKADIENTLQLGKQLGNISDPSRLQSFSKGMQDFAAATDKSLGEVSESIAAKIENGGRVRELGITFNPGDTQGNIDKFLQATGDKFGGFAEKIANSPDKAITQFKKDFEEAQGQVGGIIAQLIVPVIPVFRELLEIGQGMINIISENKTTFLLLAGAIGIMAIASEAATIAEKGQAIATGIVTGAQTLLNTVMEANPIVLVVAGIAALAAGAVYLYNNVKPVHDAFDKVWTVLKATGAFIGGFVSNEIAALAKGFSGVGKVIDGIIHLNFDEVKSGASEVGSAVTQHLTSGLAGADAAAKSLAESSTVAGVKGKEGAESAAAAEKNLLEVVREANDEYKKQAQINTDQIDFARQTFIRQSQYIRDGYAIIEGQVSKLTGQQVDAYRRSNELQIEFAKHRQEGLNADADAKDAFDKAIGASSDKEKKDQQDLLGLAKQNAQTEATLFETKLRRLRLQEGIAFSSADELLVQQKLTGEFENQITTLHSQIAALGDKDRTKFNVGLNLERAQQDLKTADLTVKVKVDSEKLLNDIFTVEAAIANKEIEVGIRPKTDTMTVLDAQLAHLQEQMAQVTFDPADPSSFAAAEKQLDDLHLQQLTLEKSKADAQDALFKQGADDAKNLANLQIGLMSDGFDKEKAALDQKYSEDVRANIRNADILKALEDKHQQDILALQKKFAHSQFDIAQTTVNGLLDLYHGFIADRKKMDESEVLDKRQALDKQNDDLLTSLAQGNISRQDYEAKLKKIAKERTDFEAQVTEESRSRIAVAIDGSLTHAQDAINQEVEAYVAGELVKELQTLLSESAKTAAVVAGSAERASSTTAENVANSANTQSTLINAVAKLIQGALGLAPGPIGLGLGLASAAVLEAAFIGIAAGIRAIGFADGGLMGLVGERGVEVVGPATDFSQMVTQLVSQTVEATERAISTRQPGQGQNGRLNVEVGGQVKVQAREFQFGLQKESLAQQNERLIPA